MNLALLRLNRLRGGKILARSLVYNTAPVGPSHRRYLNLAVRYHTALSPIGLMVELKRLEALAGRHPGRRWAARPLDIDILDYAGRRLKSRWLNLPHPDTARRAFALAPVCDIAPGWRPDGRTTAARLLRHLHPTPAEVRSLP